MRVENNIFAKTPARRRCEKGGKESIFTTPERSESRFFDSEFWLQFCSIVKMPHNFFHVPEILGEKQIEVSDFRCHVTALIFSLNEFYVVNFLKKFNNRNIRFDCKKNKLCAKFA